MDWELGEKANALAPAFPGIKPEWYFLWEYQLLKEFPPHLFGLEGPQLCLIVVSLLLGLWAVIPWLDRKARRDQPSPGFTDFGWGAILFLTFLTLKAWDIGAPPPATSPAALKSIAWVCACWTIAAGAAVVCLRFVRYQHRWFFCSGAALLHIGLHGLAGLSYLVAASIAAVLLVVALTIGFVRDGRRPATAAGST
jgi:quinol-cytochrome oxidoreductase complex cytochrome b subunit